MKTKIMLATMVLALGLVGDASASLVAHYEFEGNFEDSSDNGLHGAPVGAATITYDAVIDSNVLSLISIGYVDCSNVPLFDIADRITVTAWIKVFAFDKTWQAIVTKGDWGWRLHRSGDTNSLKFNCDGLQGPGIRPGAAGSVNVNDGRWHHVAGVYDGSKIRLYVDGVLDNSEAASGVIDITPAPVFIGGNADKPDEGYRSWNGLIDNVRIYDHALSANQVAGLAGKLGTGYTYQGRLMDSQNPADGLYDFQFRLCDTLEKGEQIGEAIQIKELDVIDGYFTVELDFSNGDPDVFNGDPRWLEIDVKPSELSDPNAYTTLDPRQLITATPYALYAKSAGDVTVPLELSSSTPDPVISGTNIGTGPGIYGEGSSGYGIYGESSSSDGVRGKNTNSGNYGLIGSSDYGVYGLHVSTGSYGAIGHNQSAVYGYSPSNYGGYFVSGNDHFDLALGGAVGRINTDPQNENSDLYLSSNNDVIIKLDNDGGEDGVLRIQNSAGSNVCTVDEQGKATVKVLQITGGADLSEQFEIRGIEKGQSPSHGMVVSIDSESPGGLVVSNKAYDRRVAGIISGAGGIQPGMLMSQSGSVAGGEHPVALTGRVYCWADATSSPIEPGDILTTSTTPGHAMKVTDYTKAQGAIIGKAMTSLREGKGLVLVLVMLQ